MDLIHYVVVKVGADDRVLSLRTTIDPEDIEVGEMKINGGWTKPRQMLAHMAFYFRYDADGHTRLNREHLERPMNYFDRFIAIAEISPWLVWLLLGTAAISAATFVILLIHIIVSG